MYSLTTPPGPDPDHDQNRQQPGGRQVHHLRAPAHSQVRSQFQRGHRDLRRQPDLPRPHPAEEGSAARAGDDHLCAALPDLQRDFLHSTAHAAGERDAEHRAVGARRPRSTSPRATSRRSRTRRDSRGQRRSRHDEAAASPAFLALAFGFGLAAIFTPCVFPMIPITMSYFIGQRGGLETWPPHSASASSFSSARSA